MIKRIISFCLLFIAGNTFATDKTPTVGCPTISVSGTAVSCFNGLNGTALVSVANGSGNYTYTWSTGSNATNIAGLSAGTYTVNVKDNVSGCTVLGAYVVNEPNAIDITSSITNVNCRPQNTGAVNITVIGGTPGYTYDWSNDGTGDFNDPEDLTNVIAGTYSLVIRDAQNCTLSRSFTITQPAEALNSSTTQINASCYASATASVDLDVWGGTFPYSYNWSNGSNNQDISNLTAGPYSVTVTDFKGCTRVSSVVITEPAQLTGTVTPSDVLCHNSPTGSISANVSGGTTPYSYSWQNSTNLFTNNSANLANMLADVYQVTVTDSKGCSIVLNGTINQPSKLILSATQVNVSCNGYSDGSIDLLPSGGVSPYTYSWSNAVPAIVGTSQDLTTLPAEVYTVTVTDFNGCTESLTREVTEPLLPLTATHEWIDVACYGNNTASIDITPNGGTLPLTYSWTNGSNSQDLTALVNGNYGYTIIDANSCIYSDVVTISQPAAPLSNTTVITPVVCYGESNGAIDLSPAGGTAPYAFTWANSTYELSNISEDLTSLPADFYQFVITDANNCVFGDTVEVQQPPLLQSTISGVDILCKYGVNGSVDLNVIGGVTPYQYAWSNGASTQDLANLPAGTYNVLVTDFNNCTINNQITLTEPDFELTYDSIIRHVKCNNGTDGRIEVSIAGGTLPYNYNWSNGSTFPLADELVAGNYSFLVTDGNGCLIGDTLTVTQPDPLFMNEIITPVTCKGLSDGIIDVSPTGGTMPYAYTWYTSAFALANQNQDLVDFPADTYQLEIVDSNNCFYEAFWLLPEPELLEASFTSDNVNCAGGSDGSILVDVVGGNPGYTYAWSNGATTEDIINVPIGIYSFMVTDTKNCQDSLKVQIFEPDPISTVFDIYSVSCKDQYDGAVMAFPAGGTGNYYYEWSTGSENSMIENLATETYYLNITDILGCSLDTVVFVPKTTEDCVFPVNAFSPNDDNYNDTWFIENMELYDSHMQIFNKWGNLVYETKGIYEPWDGKIKGAAAPSETYYYILLLNNGDADKLSGSVTIIR